MMASVNDNLEKVETIVKQYRPKKQPILDDDLAAIFKVDDHESLPKDAIELDDIKFESKDSQKHDFDEKKPLFPKQKQVVLNKASLTQNNRTFEIYNKWETPRKQQMNLMHPSKFFRLKEGGQ